MQTLKRRRRARRRMRRLLLPLLLILLAILGLCQLLRNRDGGETRQPETRELSTQERENLSELPERLQDLYNSNPDARRFVLEYTEKKDADPVVDLSEYENCTQVPLLMQWDERWGYKPYAGYLFGLTGCGPTCLSMCAIYLTGNPDYSPEYVRTFAIENGYYVENNGSTWTLISEGGPMLGLDVTEIPDAEEGQTVTVFGTDHGAALPVELLAAKTDTINYEIICGISRRVPRVYLKHGTVVHTTDYML